MTIRPLLRFQNPDSTRDLNDRTRGLFNKGVFSGGTLETAPSSLTVTLLPFATVGFDGMLVREDENNVLSVNAGERNYIVIRQRYVDNGPPVASVEAHNESAYLGDPEIDYLITFAVVDVPLAATEVDVSDIEYYLRDELDPLGRTYFRGQVDNTGQLPDVSTNANRAGDFYIVTDGSGGLPELWAWTGLDWQNITKAQTFIDLLTEHQANLDVNLNHLTDDQADAALGTIGSPNNTNRYVTSLDPRVPTQDENNALQGGASLYEDDPDASNRYVTHSRVFVAPAELAFVASALIELPDSEGPYYVGAGGTGSAQVYFNIYSDDGEDQELLNSEFSPVRVTGVFTEPSLTLELDPSTSGLVDDSFFSGGSLFLQVDNTPDLPFRISYGKRAVLRDIPPESLILRGPQSGQVDARVRQLLANNVNAHFVDSYWDGGVSPGDVVAFDSGSGQFVLHNIGSSLFPVGIRGNSNNVIMEGLYVFPSPTAFSAGDRVYAPDPSGALTTSPSDWFIGTFIDDSTLLVNMNAFGISASSGFIPGTSFSATFFDDPDSPVSGEVAFFNGTDFVTWDYTNPAHSPAPVGIRGNFNNIIQSGLYTTTGTPFNGGDRYYADLTTPGALTTTPNDFFVGEGIGIGATNDLFINCNSSPIWEEAREQFSVEHDDSSGVHLEGSARAFIGVAADAGASTSNSLASSTGMVLYATDVSRLYTCTDGATNTWAEIRQPWVEIDGDDLGVVGSFEITNLTNDYLAYRLIFTNSRHSAAPTEVYVQFSVDNGSTYKGAGEYAWVQNRVSNGSVSGVSTTDGDIAITYSNDSGSSKWIDITIYEPGASGVVTGLIHQSLSVNTGVGIEYMSGGGFDTSAGGTVINAIRVSATNNFTAGTWKLLGLLRDA